MMTQNMVQHSINKGIWHPPDYLRTPKIEHTLEFMDALEILRRNCDAITWKRAILKNYYIAFWRFFLSSDPYTRWGLLKPKGYPGDATLMDFAYGHKSVSTHLDNAGDVGKQIYKATFNAPQSDSARKRVRFIAQSIDELAATRDNLRIGSFASGHGREFEMIQSMSSENINIFYAIDSDETSIKELTSSNHNINIYPVHKNVFRLQKGFLEKLNLDLSYSLGLFDYLDLRQAKHVLGAMWNATSYDGTLIVGNLVVNQCYIAG
jgi:hypothetical protein